jgi:hypothetical protein
MQQKLSQGRRHVKYFALQRILPGIFHKPLQRRAAAGPVLSSLVRKVTEVWMAAALTAMSISGGILLVVVVFVVIITIATVNRGATAMQDDSQHGGGHDHH